MSRLAVLFKIDDQELEDLKKQKKDDMYEYMLENIENKYLRTDRAYELNKAWEGIHFCINEGFWIETEHIPDNIIFGGEFLLDHNNYVITLKKPSDIKLIVEYLKENNIQDIIKKNFNKIPENDYSLPKDEENLQFLLEWGEGSLDFYKGAMKENFNVIFTVDI